MNNQSKNKFNNWIFAEEFYSESETVKSIKDKALHELSSDVKMFAPSVNHFAKFFSNATKATSIIVINDLGAALTYSLCESLEGTDYSITSIYSENKSYEFAKSLFYSDKKYKNNVRVILGDYETIFSRLSDNAYDLIILDSKDIVPTALVNESERLLSTNGNLVITNALCDDKLYNPVNRDNEVAVVRDTIEVFKKSESFVSTFLPLSDGLFILNHTENK